jgi:tetratricopeptide (TPR) repeat protein
MLQSDRVAEVFVPSRRADDGRVGSGYFLSDGLVLTAAHLVRRRGSVCQVRPLGEGGWLRAEVVWRGQPPVDAALLRVASDGASAGLASPPAPLGRIATGRRAPCRLIGFPLAQEQASARKLIRDTEEIVGEIIPLSGHKSGYLNVHVRGSLPKRAPSRRSSWEGLSGAAVFSGDLLVGVAVSQVGRFLSRLQAVSMEAIVRRRAAAAALAGGGLDVTRLEAVEDAETSRRALREPYLTLPAQMSGASPTSPESLLLRPEFGIVPFHGREELLEELGRWCFLESDLSVILMTGSGGTGKTRLAAELCARMREHGWLGGFARPSASAADLTGLVELVSPLLIVIDDVEGRVEQAAAVVEGLAESASAPPARVVLTSRGSGEWLATLSSRVHPSPKAAAALGAARFLALRGAEQSVVDRRSAFRAAVRAFAGKLDAAANQVAMPDLSDSLYESTLFVHLAALTVLGETALPERSELRDHLLQSLLARERQYWRETAEAYVDLDSQTLARAVAISSLTRADSEEEAVRLLRALPELADRRTAKTRRKLARWLHDLYPGATFLPALEPDVLADALISAAIDEAPELPSRLLRLASAAVSIRILVTLGRSAVAHPQVESALEQALAAHLQRAWKPALAAAQQLGDPLGRAFATTLERIHDPELGRVVFDALPKQTVALRELAVVAARQAVDAARARPAGPERAEVVAGRLNNLSIRLREAGHLEESVEVAEEVVRRFRALRTSEGEAFDPDLAMALTNGALSLGAVGRDDDALKAAQDSVAIRRRLATSKRRFVREMALSLNNLSNRLGAVGHAKEALETLEEAVNHYHRVVDREPEHEVELAMTLNNLSGRRAGAGQAEAALEASEEAVAILRRLADISSQTLVPELAAALNNLSNRLAAVGRDDEALAAIWEAAEHYRRLAQGRPEIFLPRLATTLSNLSGRLYLRGQLDVALTVLEDAIEARRLLAASGLPARRRELATSLERLALLLSELGRPREAAKARRESAKLEGVASDNDRGGAD